MSEEEDEIAPESSSSSERREIGVTPNNIRSEYKSESQVENEILRQKLAAEEAKRKSVEIELKMLRESQLIKIPVLPFDGMYDPSPKSRARRESWQNLTEKPIEEDSCASGRNP